MLNLFYEGGPLFMSIISLLALAALFFGFRSVKQPSRQNRYYIRYFGMLALVCGILGQLIGLYEALQAIVSMGEVSQKLLAGGLRISSITTLYGLIVFLLTHLAWFFLDYRAKQQP